MKVGVLLLSLLMASPAYSEFQYKAGKVDCAFANPDDEKSYKEVRLAIPKEEPWHFTYRGVFFMVRIKANDEVTLGGEFKNVKGEPYAEAVARKTKHLSQPVVPW